MNKIPRICFIFIILFCFPSCIFLDVHDCFNFYNETDNGVLLLFDFDTSNKEISIASIAESHYMIGYCQEHNLSIIDDTDWDKSVNDSLYLYILKDAITVDSVYIKYPQYIKEPFYTIYEDFITEQYIKENLIARMTIKLEDIFPTTYPPKELYFPPEDESYYNTIFYNVFSW